MDKVEAFINLIFFKKKIKFYKKYAYNWINKCENNLIIKYLEQ